MGLFLLLFQKTKGNHHLDWYARLGHKRVEFGPSPALQVTVKLFHLVKKQQLQERT
jgi:hypothetical protein